MFHSAAGFFQSPYNASVPSNLAAVCHFVGVAGVCLTYIHLVNSFFRLHLKLAVEVTCILTVNLAVSVYKKQNFEADVKS